MRSSRNLRSVVAQVGRAIRYRRNLSPSDSTIEHVVGLLVRGTAFYAGFGVAGPLLTGDHVSELEETRQKDYRDMLGDSAEIVDLRETACLRDSVWAQLSGNVSRIFTGDKKN